MIKASKVCDWRKLEHFGENNNSELIVASAIDHEAFGLVERLIKQLIKTLLIMQYIQLFINWEYINRKKTKVTAFEAHFRRSFILSMSNVATTADSKDLKIVNHYSHKDTVPG